eukprot:m.33220 g.33220  ORF g.33220 m.33220 type:complete len:450 (+) comp12209_c0_seq1:296-1645(+)
MATSFQLDQHPRLTVILALKFLQAFGYYGFSITLPLLLSANYAMSDDDAGLYYGIFGMLISIFSAGSGALTDRIGVRSALLIGAVLIVLGRVGVWRATSATMAVWALNTVLACGESFGVPVLSAAVGESVPKEHTTYAYGLFYTALNVAVLCVGPAMDLCRWGCPESTDTHTSACATSPYQLMVVLTIGAGVVSLLLVLFGLRGQSKTQVSVGSFSSLGSKTMLTNPNAKPKANASAKQSKPSVWKFFTLAMCLVGVRMLFRHLDASFPKYMLRAFGLDVPFGIVYSINPITIITLVPALTSKTPSWLLSSVGLDHVRVRIQAMHPVDAILLGSIVSSTSVLFMALSQTVLAAALFVFTLSLGEALWSPRFYDYTYEVAPAGSSGWYFAIANAPLFLPKLATGILSGRLLQEHCASYPCAQGQQMWWMVFLTGVPFPLAIWLLSRWLKA